MAVGQYLTRGGATGHNIAAIWNGSTWRRLRARRRFVHEGHPVHGGRPVRLPGVRRALERRPLATAGCTQPVTRSDLPVLDQGPVEAAQPRFRAGGEDIGDRFEFPLGHQMIMD